MDDLEKELIVRVAKQDRMAFEQLVKATYPRFFRYLRRMHGNRSDIEDLMQEGYMAIWAKANQYNASEPFNPWAYKVFYHKFIDYTRKHQHDPAPLESEPSGKLTTEQLVLNQERQAALAAFVNEINEKDRAAFVLFYYQNMSAKQIAHILDMTEQAVQSALYRLRKSLRTALEGH